MIGFVIGAGSVTTAYARELFFKNHPEMAKDRGKLPVITTLINIGLGLVFISGMGLYLENPTYYSNSPGFILKMVMVLILLLNHTVINVYIRPKHGKGSLLATFSDTISLYGWYAIIVVSVLA